jgi:DoxX-like family
VGCRLRRAGLGAQGTRNHAIAHAAAVAGLAGVFAYQGLVPKLWRVDVGALAIWQGLGLTASHARWAVRSVGAVEAGFAVATVAGANKRWPFVVAFAAMPALVIDAAKADRSILTNAFNPVSLGIAVSALAAVALTTTDGRPSGRRPLRRAPDQQPDVGNLP